MGNRESEVLGRILLGLRDSTPRATLFRNNVGARRLDDGTFLRYGVGGKGGSDLIGLLSFDVAPRHVGLRVAAFVAIEVKDGTGRTTPEQDHFIGFVAGAGGLAGVARSPEDVADILAI